MNKEELCYLSIAELAPLIRSRQVSPVEVTRAVLDRIDRLDGKLNAYITVLRQEALAAAAAAEREILSGRYRGPLHGVPVSVKDLFATRGVRTTAGSKILADWVPDHDAAAVEALQRAGAILVGKTNLHEFAFGVTTENPHYGPTHNPWDWERVPGGSSGGSGAAVAAGLCFASLGTDTGGSIRIPASLCGTVGLKPTYGRVSRFGVISLAWSLDHVGPLTRSVEDAALVLQAIAGRDPRDPASADIPVPDFGTLTPFTPSPARRERELGGEGALFAGDVRGMRLGMPREHFFEGLDEGVLQTVKAAIGKLATLGAEVEEVSLPHVPHAPRALMAIILSESAAYHEPYLRSRPQDYGEDVRGRLEAGRFVLATDYLRAQRVRRLVGEEFAEAFRRVDLIVVPTLPITAPKIGQREVSLNGRTVEVRATLTRFTNTFNLMGLPAISVPGGFSPEGLPIGFQIVGRPFAEGSVLRAAHAYEASAGWRDRRPPL